MPLSKNIKIGERIRRLRGEKSQVSFAFEAGVSIRAFKYYEAGDRIPPGSVLAKIAEICHTTVDWILTGNEKADRVAESIAPYGIDDVSKKIMDMLKDMDKEGRQDVLKYAEEKKQAAAWRRGRKLKGG